MIRLLFVLALVAASLACCISLSLAGCDNDENQSVVLLAPGQVPGVNLVLNGSFELPAIASAPYVSYLAGRTFGWWNVDAGSVDHISGRFWYAADGSQSVDLNSCSSGTIRQELPTQPSRSYLLRFAVAGNPDGLPPEKEIEVRWSGTILDTVTFDGTGRSRSEMGWSFHRYVVQADTTITRLVFRSLTSGCYGPVLDAVSVQELTDPLSAR